MLALLISEIADISGTIVPDAPDQGDAEQDENHLMERFLAKKPTGASTEKVVEKQTCMLTELLGNPVEMELRSLVAAMDLSEGAMAKRRAGALLQRIDSSSALDQGEESPR